MWLFRFKGSNPMKTFYFIRKLKDRLAAEVISGGPEKGTDAILLMHDAVYEKWAPEGVRIFACREDVAARGIETPYPAASYEEIARMIVEYDRTIVW